MDEQYGAITLLLLLLLNFGYKKDYKSYKTKSNYSKYLNL